MDCRTYTWYIPFIHIHIVKCFELSLLFIKDFIPELMLHWFLFCYISKELTEYSSSPTCQSGGELMICRCVLDRLSWIVLVHISTTATTTIGGLSTMDNLGCIFLRCQIIIWYLLMVLSKEILESGNDCVMIDQSFLFFCSSGRWLVLSFILMGLSIKN